MAPEKDIEKAVPAKAAGADKKPCLDRVLGSKHGVKIIAVGSCLVIAGAIIGVLYATCASGRRLRSFFGSRGAATDRRSRAKHARAERRSRTRAGARDAPQVLGCGGGGGGGGGTADEGYRLRF